MNNFPKLHTTNLAQELYTPKDDAKKILKFINKEWVIWECCYGRGDMADAFKEEGYKVVGNKDLDFFETDLECDVIVTNPPFRNNKDFLSKALKSNKPIAFLMRLEHLGGVKASELLKDENIQLGIPKRRINFITPKMRDGKKVGGSQFHTIWITRGLNLPKDIYYMD